MNYWWAHSNPPFAISSGISAFITGSIALTFILSFFASEAGSITRLVSRDSPLLPTTVGLVLAAAGIYGMLVLIDDEYVAFEWPFYAAVFAAGIYILRRTFTVED
jgi:high-affinity K+ transport system ATPase subunit B